MIKTFTKNELVKYLYNESSNEENIEIYQQKLTNDDFEEELSDFGYVQKLVDSFTLKTPVNVTEAILKYSAEYK